MATVADIITYARQLAQTDSSGIPDALGLAFCNDALQNMTRSLVARDIDAAQTQESYTNLTTNNPNTYAWPVDMYSLKTIEVDFTGSGGQNYLQATMVEVANIQNVSFDWLRLNQPISQPLFDNRGDTFEIFPIPPNATANGLRIFYFLQPTEYADLTSTINYPQSLDYRCLAARVASLYALSQEKTGMKNRYSVSVMTALENEYQTRLKDIITILAPASQQPITPQPLAVTGWNL